VGMLSGPVGNYTNINPYVEEYVCRKLGLSVETISSQIIPRDRYAMYFSTIGVIASSIERISIELRQLQMTEISEVAESFSSSQKGSSAMPHKKNPILLENVTGLSRMVKAYVSPALDNVSLWQERDMSHSSVERIIGPDATITLDFAIHRLTQIISNLVINEQSMLENLNLLNGVTYSQPVLLRLIEKGLNKEKAYRMVQKSAQKTMANGLDFLTELRSDDDYAEWLSEEELVRIFDPLVLNVRVDTIFERLLNEFDPA
ncbi:MAG: lyase family protein, partial [Rhodobacteraceae bacterium]|nr:lyase family protein [Paracoccaceae bacterium]